MYSFFDQINRLLKTKSAYMYILFMDEREGQSSITMRDKRRDESKVHVAKNQLLFGRSLKNFNIIVTFGRGIIIVVEYLM